MGARRARQTEAGENMGLPTIDPLIAGGVVLTTAFTDAIYVQFTAAVAARRRFAAASWSSVWYLLAAFAVISYTSNWAYVLFAALGSWIGGFLSITALNRAAQSRPGGGRGSPHGHGPT
jgi:uncharacterized membrane protein YhaH (DUF805 family)